MMYFCFLVGVHMLMWPHTIMSKLRGRNRTRNLIKAAWPLLVCQHLQPVCCVCVCVCHTRWCECDTRLSRLPFGARWGSLHVEPLDITVSSVNWPLTPGHFMLGVNDVFTPLHNKQHRVCTVTNDTLSVFGLLCLREKYKEVTILLFFCH